MKRTLNDWLAWQEQVHPKAWDLGLERIGKVWQRLNPRGEKIARHILTISGTNGKGSCVRWAEEICRAHGISVAAFSSPHLRNYRERIRFNGEMVHEKELVAAFNAIDAARGDISLTYFEWSALAMFYLTQQKNCEVAVLEVGLGGRLDATNLIDADAAIITRIGLDHQDWLGDDRETIGREKAGVMRKNQRVFIADDNDPPASLAAQGAEVGAIVSWFGRDFRAQENQGQLQIDLPAARWRLPLPTFMTGAHQFAHLAAVMYALSPWIKLDNARLAAVVATTQNEGRLMKIAGAPSYLLDVAHNIDSASVLAAHLRRQGSGRADFYCTNAYPVTGIENQAEREPPLLESSAELLDKSTSRYLAVCGMLRDKDQVGILKIMQPIINQWYFAELDGARKTPTPLLQENAQTAGIDSEKMEFFANVNQALTAAQQNAQSSDTIVVFGSFLTVCAALEELL